jgi:FlaA1/EpsC-like NDP-sugar epimerase
MSNPSVSRNLTRHLTVLAAYIGCLEVCWLVSYELRVDLMLLVTFLTVVFASLIPTPFVTRNFQRHLQVLAVYTTLLLFSLWLSYELRFDFKIHDPKYPENLVWIPLRHSEYFWIVPLELVFLYLFGQFRGFLSYFRLTDLFRVVWAIGTVFAILVVMWVGYNQFQHDESVPPISVIILNLLLATLLVSAFRVGLRSYREGQSSGRRKGLGSAQRRVAIVGAGDVGSAVAADLLAKRGLGLKPVAFFDDNTDKHGLDIHGIPVVGSPDQFAVARDAYEFEQIIIALPSTAHRRILEVVSRAKALGLETEIMPSMWDLASGRAQASQVRPVELEDLLGRDPVSLDSAQIDEMFRDRVVMVTGAGGSIGSELCRQIANRNPKRLIIVDHSEVQLFQIEQELVGMGHVSLIVPCVATVLDGERMDWIMRTYRPALIFHAAAHKHVPMMEHQPVEALKNNTLGTQLLAQLASQNQVGKFIFISTDKAVNPTSVMGCSKRLAEIAIQALQQAPGNVTQFCAVRFGNVLGSSGSVIPTFKRQIAEGGPVTVTHPDVMRYFMTIPESVGLVLQAATQATGGEIFVLDMGQPIKIIDVARQLIELSGFRPDIDIEIKYIGLRPGEKLFEEFKHEGELFQDTAHKRIHRFVCQPATPAQVDRWLGDLKTQLVPGARDQVKQFLTQIVPEYTPYVE